jgi:hypothetical protein
MDVARDIPDDAIRVDPGRARDGSFARVSVAAEYADRFREAIDET